RLPSLSLFIFDKILTFCLISISKANIRGEGRCRRQMGEATTGVSKALIAQNARMKQPCPKGDFNTLQVEKLPLLVTLAKHKGLINF
ncbi:MAG: hypothetical protein JWO03_856, partial [Bacteroidetes bacterium]|nr:hypothetical protein [Bacteroidota bacterium]